MSFGNPAVELVDAAAFLVRQRNMLVSAARLKRRAPPQHRSPGPWLRDAESKQPPPPSSAVLREWEHLSSLDAAAEQEEEEEDEEVGGEDSLGSALEGKGKSPAGSESEASVSVGPASAPTRPRSRADVAIRRAACCAYSTFPATLRSTSCTTSWRVSRLRSHTCRLSGTSGESSALLRHCRTRS
jgi:hypothetical protein